MAQSSFRILIAEDNVKYHRIYKATLEDAVPGSTVSFAEDGEQALARIQEMPDLDLLIADLNMPRVTGEQLIDILRGEPRYDSLPIVVLTGTTDHMTQTRLLEKGANDFIEKGSPPEILIARIRTQLRSKEAMDRIAAMTMDMEMFTSGVLHDIRNIETAISCLAHLIKTQVEDDPVAHRESIVADLDSLLEQSSRISSYGSQIIQKVKETQHTLKPSPVEITTALGFASSSVTKSHPDLKDGLYTIEGTLLPVVADSHFLNLVFLNLMQNAVKYSRPGITPHVMISQTSTAGAAGGQSMVLTHFRDNGRGIPREELRQVFEPFVRLKRDQDEGVAIKSQGEGFGLGLALVRRAVHKMGGRIWAEEPTDGKGPGALFCLELPAAN